MNRVSRSRDSRSRVADELDEASLWHAVSSLSWRERFDRAQGGRRDIARYPLVEAKPDGTGRLQAMYWESEGVLLTRVGYALANDAPAGEHCSLNQFTDGNDRCAFSLGSVGLGDEYYGDRRAPGLSTRYRTSHCRAAAARRSPRAGFRSITRSTRWWPRTTLLRSG